MRYERLRWIFIDEVSIASAQLLSAFEDNVRRSTRAEHAWAMRSATRERRWGGVNVVYCGDFWQFRPVKASSIIDRLGELRIGKKISVVTSHICSIPCMHNESK